MKMQSKSAILGSGIYLPERKLSNTELESILQLEPGFIEDRTGIKERRWALDHETVEYMASEAALNAVRDSKIKKVDGLVIARDLIGTRRAYSIGLPIMERLSNEGINIDDCFSMDLVNYCPGFVHATNIANLMVSAGQGENVLVVASTRYTDMVNTDGEFNSQFGERFDSDNNHVRQYSLKGKAEFQPPSMNGFLWGNGAGAVIIGKSDEEGIVGFKARASRKIKKDTYGIGESDSEKSFGSLDGKSIYRYAISEVPTFIQDFTQQERISEEEIDVLIPHQPNPRMLSDLRKRIKIPSEKVLVSCDRLGNMIGASVPITYHLGIESGQISTGDRVMFCSFGDSYLTTAGLLFRQI